MTDPKPVTEARPKTDPKSAETNPAADTKTDMPAETGPAAETPPEKKLLPATVPVATAEEAEKLNEEANEYVRPFENRSQHIKNGFKLVINDKLKRFQTVRPSSKQETALNDRGYDLEEFRKRQIPQKWALDYDALPNAASFHISSDGFFLDTGKGCVRLSTGQYDSMRSTFFAEITVKNESRESECEIELGVQGAGTKKNGYEPVKKERLSPGQEKMFQWEISVYDCYYEIRPAISINGMATLKEYNLYRKDHKEITIVEGEIAERSPLPDPQATDYPDCRYTAHFVGNSIANGSPCNKEIVLSVDGFIGKKVLPTSKLKQKDKIKCAVVPFDSVPEEFSGTQEADTLSLFELDSYLLLSYKEIDSFHDYSESNLGITFKDDGSSKTKYVSIYEKQINPPLTEEEKEAQKESISKDLLKIEQLLLPYTDQQKEEINIKFKDAWDKEKVKDPPGMNRIGRYVWRNKDNSFYVLPESYNIINDYSRISQHNIEALVALKDYLESQGVQLIISLVPDYYDISARVINREFSNLPDFRTAGVVRQLLENGIEAVYASDAIIEKYNKYENPFFYPCNAHPGDLIQDVLSDLITEKLSRFHIPRQMEKDDFQAIQQEFFTSSMPLSDFSFPENCDIGDHKPGDFYSVNRIRYRNRGIKSDPDSPIMVLGNSYSTSPEPLSHYLCMKTGIGIYQYAIAGAGMLLTAIQRLFNNPDVYLAKRKALVLAIGTIHLTSKTTIPNICDLDSDAKRMHDSNLLATIELQGSEASIPGFAQQLSNPAILKTDGNGVCPILDNSSSVLPSLDPAKDGFAVIYYCFSVYTPLELVANGLAYPLIGSDTSVYSKQIIPIHAGENGFSVKMVGNPNTLFAIGKIQIWQ